MFRLIILVCCIFLYSCKGDNSNTKAEQIASHANDSLKLFSAIEKDSTYFISYQFSKQIAKGGVINYIYKSNEVGGFIIACDTANRYFKLTGDRSDTTLLDNDGDRFYTINGKEYKVLKLIADKGVTDGEVSYFVSIDFGLLLSKSNTWRIGKFLNPEKVNNGSLELTALLYRVLTEDDFLKNPQPESKIKFTPPKVE
ncbi:MAG TPA: hypothetical protein PKA46_15960 [Ferruginibacter sp.]|nr:hypothetical protein [Ferruginibacter sp.]